MLLAVAGTVCLVMVVVTSVRAARRRLRYESWHLLHLYAYLGVGLALPHQLWTGQEFLGSPGRDGVLVGPLGGGRPARCWSGGSALPLWRSARHRLRVTSVVPRGARRGVGLHDRPAPGPAAGRGRAVLHLAVPRPGPAGPGRTRTPCRPRPTAAACGSPSRSSATAARALRHVRPGTRVLVEGPYGRLSARGPHPPQGGAHRRRGRHHPAAGAGRGAATTRPGDAVLLHRFTGRPLFARRARRARPRARAAGRLAAGPPPRRRTPGSATASGTVDDLDRADATGCPTSPSATSTSAAPRAWAEDVRRTTSAAGLPADHFHVETLRVVTAMRRIVLWFMSTLTVVVLLFGYHTSTSSELAAGATSVVRPGPGLDRLRHDRHGTGSDTSSRTTAGRARHRAATTVTGPSMRHPVGARCRCRSPSRTATITDVTVVEYPVGNGKDQQINAYALPVLVQETLDAQSADIDMVSGATVTSERLHRVAAERARPGRAVTAATGRAGTTARYVEHVMGMPISLALRGAARRRRRRPRRLGRA